MIADTLEQGSGIRLKTF